ncbi:divalent-cation tolerance protein CutA [candidate division KSB1 bacterium]|nr:divalent-cation tolerance protein CutA [candidate division KSB1 bacterium]
MEQLVLVYITCPTEAEAKSITDALLKERLAACVNLVPQVISFFHWKGTIENETEVLLMVKTRQACLEHLKKTVLRLHSYDVPEILACPIIAGSEDYINWVIKETTEKKGT